MPGDEPRAVDHRVEDPGARAALHMNHLIEDGLDALRVEGAVVGVPIEGENAAPRERGDGLDEAHDRVARTRELGGHAGTRIEKQHDLDRKTVRSGRVLHTKERLDRNGFSVVTNHEILRLEIADEYAVLRGHAHDHLNELDANWEQPVSEATSRMRVCCTSASTPAAVSA